MKRIYDQHVSLFLVAGCPNECDFCLAGAGPTKKSFMSLGDVERILSDHPGTWREVSLGGGEPALHPDVDGVILGCRDWGWDVLLHTNDLDLSRRAVGMFTGRGGMNSLSITVSFNDRIVTDTEGLVGLRKYIEGLGDPRIDLYVNVFDNPHNNDLIDMGFRPGSIVKVPKYALGRAAGMTDAVMVPTNGMSGHIYTTDLVKFPVTDYVAACEHQMSLD